MSELKIGVVGLGRGQAHVSGINETEGAELTAVCDIKPGLVKEIAEENGANAYTDYEEMLKKEDLDIVNICTPSGLHCDMALKAAEKNIHVLSEKPLDIDLDKIDKTVEVFAEKELKLGCIFQNRFKPENKRKKEIVESGKLGRLIFSNAHIKWYRTQEYYEKNEGWHGTWDLDGGGSLINQSVHTIDLMQWMMGPVSSVVGRTHVWAHDIETEDMGVALVKFRSGATGTIVGSTACYPGFGTRLEIHGVNGGISNGRCLIKSEEEEPEELSLGYDAGGSEEGSSDPRAISSDTTVQQIQDMIDAVKENKEPAVTGKDARHAVEIILAIYESARRGKEVFLPLQEPTVIN
ncbi:MAG: Gfo/Idh/MocA family protein [Halanaerobiaceae bacterium]